MRDEPAGAEHLAGDLGVDAFIPVGEAVVAEEGEDDDGGEESGESSGENGLAASDWMLGSMRWWVRGGHVNNIRDGCWTGRADGSVGRWRVDWVR